LLLSVIDGEAREKSLGLEWGQHRRPFSVGAEGEWAVRAPGVADVHLYLAFRGSRLCVAPASAETRVRAGGVRLPETWSELPLPAELRFGQARLRARAALSSKDTLATTHEVDPKKLAPLLDASRPHGARSRAALQETVLQPTAQQQTPPAHRSPLLETMCDGGALLREAERIAAEARAKAPTEPAAAASPALHAPDPSAFAAAERADAIARRAAVVQQLAHGLRSLRWSSSSLRWPSLRAAVSASARVRRAALAALAAVLLAVLVLRLLAPASASAPDPEDTGASANEHATLAEEEQEHAGLGTASAEASPEPSTRAELAPAASEVTSPVTLQASSPSPQLQREAFRAAVSGDSAAAAALYQQLSLGPDARVYQLAARYAAQGRVRKP
jgi:hypothetical protein